MRTYILDNGTFMADTPERQAGAAESEAELSPEGIRAAARVIADAFDLEFEGYRAGGLAMDVLQAYRQAANPKTS